MTVECNIAYFVSHHGFGHAARASAVMDSVRELTKDSVRFHIFTMTPEWFFRDSLSGPFVYHARVIDVGLVQRTSTQEDPDETVKELDRFLPFSEGYTAELADLLRRTGCSLAVCDIAPLGIAVAERAEIPSVLVENFTWDWIYRGYEARCRRIGRHADFLEAVFQRADYHIQTEPVCRMSPGAFVTGPVSRKIKNSAAAVRSRLGIPEEKKVVLITMGGIPEVFDSREAQVKFPDVAFIVPGPYETASERENCIFLPHRSGFFHTDLVNASDAVVGKAGYSTLAEVYHAGAPYGYLSRKDFKEAGVLADFIEAEMRGAPVDEEAFRNGGRIGVLPDLLSLGRIERNEVNGSVQAARFILDTLDIT